MGTVRLLILVVLSALAVVSTYSQDLGSSNKLFGGAGKKSPVKKAPARHKTVPAKARVTNKPKAAAKAKAADTKKAKESVAKSEPIVIKTGAGATKASAKAPNAAVAASPSNAAANELYDKLIDDGNAARDDRSYATAEAAYKRAKGIKPKDARAIFGLGNLYSDQQRWDAAEAAYRDALKLDADNATMQIALSYVLAQPISAENLGERYEEAERLARRATELQPQNALAFDQLGVAMELRGLISAETENAYRTAIRLRPSFAPPYAHLGRLLRRKGRVKEASDAYENAVRYSTDVATMILVADVMQSEQRYVESEPLLRAAVANDPRNPTGLLLLGQALMTAGKYADAEPIIRRSVEVSPNAFISNSLLASLYMRQNRLDMAESSLLQALKFVAPNEKRRLALQFEDVGDGYLKAGSGSNAARAFRQASTLDPENQTITAKLAQSHR